MRKIARGFTLVELMIVVAIIGILAAIAIPNFIKYQLRSKQGELRLQLKAILTCEESLRQAARNLAVNGVVVPVAEFAAGQYWDLGGTPHPGGVAGTAKLPWSDAELGDARAIDWLVEGRTYGQYQISVQGAQGSPPATNSGIAFFAGAQSDLDGDGFPAQFALNHRRPSAAGAWSEAMPPAAAGAFPGLGCIEGASNIYSSPCATTGPDEF